MIQALTYRNLQKIKKLNPLLIITSVVLTSCIEESANEKPSKPSSSVEVTRNKTITILSDSCAKPLVEEAIIATRNEDQTIGFNVYYSKNSLPDVNIIDFDVALCNQEKININMITRTKDYCESFLNNLSDATATNK